MPFTIKPEVRVRPAGRETLPGTPWNAIRMVGVGRVDVPSRKHPPWSVPQTVPRETLRLHGAPQMPYLFNIKMLYYYSDEANGTKTSVVGEDALVQTVANAIWS